MAVLFLIQKKSEGRIMIFNKVFANLYVGDRGAVKKQNKVREVGITAVVRLDNAPRELGEWENDFTVLDLPFIDRNSIPNGIIEQVTGFIHKQIQSKKPVLVHCERGISRSVSLIMAYLIQYEKMSLAEAFCAVKKVRSIAQPHQKLLISLIQHYSLPYDIEKINHPDFLEQLIANCD